MQRTKKLVLPLLIAFLLSSFFVSAQTADEIVKKHIEAIGGKDVISKVKSLIIDAELSVMGATMPNKTTILAGKGFKNETEFNGQSIIQVYTPTGGWTINPLQGMTEAQAVPEEQAKANQSTFDLGGEFFNITEKGNKVDLVGTEKLDGVSVYKLKLTNKDSKESLHFIDASTYYLVKSEFTTQVNGSDMTASTVFSNYKKTDIGYVMAFTTVSSQGFELTINVNKVEFNKEVDPKIFEMPK